MGKTVSEALAAAFRSAGLNAKAHPPADKTILKLGRANTSCKECLPLILTTGTLLNYIYKEKQENEILVYMMPTASGPCRFGQYSVFMESLIKRLELPDVALFSLSSADSYTGLGNDFFMRSWWGFVTSDVMEDIRSLLLTNSVDPEEAMEIFNSEWALILRELETGSFQNLENQLISTARRFALIPRKHRPEEIPVILLSGEIFVRRDSLSRQNLTENLAARGFAAVCSPVTEWILYTDYLLDNGLTGYTMSKTEKLSFLFRKKLMARHEKRLKSILSKSGLVNGNACNIKIKEIVNAATPYISPNLTGEAVLTVGSALTEMASHACGVIAIGPFGCMPNRISEAVLSETMNREGKLAADPKNEQLKTVLKNMDSLPFLAIESDGSPFPQLIDAKLDTFCLQSGRLHEQMLAGKKEKRKKSGFLPII